MRVWHQNKKGKKNRVWKKIERNLKNRVWKKKKEKKIVAF